MWEQGSSVNATTLSAISCSVHRTRPSGGPLHAVAMMCASTSPWIVFGLPLRAFSSMTFNRSPLANCNLIFLTVDTQQPTSLAICSSGIGVPWLMSAFSSIWALLTALGLHLPAELFFLRYSLSSLLKFTWYSVVRAITPSILENIKEFSKAKIILKTFVKLY